MKQLKEFRSREQNKLALLTEGENNDVLRKVIGLNLRRVEKRERAYFAQLPSDTMPFSGMTSADKPGSRVWVSSPLPWADEERVDEDILYRTRKEKCRRLLHTIESEQGASVDIKFKDDGVWYRVLVKRKIVEELHVSELLSKSEVRVILRGGLSELLGLAFRSMIISGRK